MNCRFVVLCLVAQYATIGLSAQQRVHRYTVSPIDVVGTGVVGVDDNGWVVTRDLSGGQRDYYLCRPGVAPSLINSAIPPTAFLRAVGSRGLVAGDYVTPAGRVDGFVADLRSGTWAPFNSPPSYSSVGARFVTADGWVVGQASLGPGSASSYHVVLATVAGYQRSVSIPLSSGATGNSFTVYDAASGPWIALRDYQERLAGGGFGLVQQLLMSPSGQLIPLPRSIVSVSRVGASGQALVYTSSQPLRQGLFYGGTLEPLPHSTAISTDLTWSHIAGDGSLYANTFTPLANNRHQVVRVAGRVLRVDSLVDDLQATALGGYMARSSGGAVLAGTLPSAWWTAPARHGGHVGAVVLFPTASPCLALQIDAPSMTLSGRSRVVSAGQMMSMTMFGGQANQLAAVFVLDPQTGLPLLLVASGRLDNDGEATLALQIPTGRGGVEVQLRAFALDTQFGILSGPIRVVKFQ